MRLDDGDAEGIRRVGMAVKRGAVIVYPTDTVYGIGGNPFDAGAVRRIMEIKRRGERPMPVLVSGIEGALALIEAEGLAKALMQRLWPGALTIVAKRAAGAPRSPAFGRGTVGVRMPNHVLALKIIEAAGGAVIGTSANISGRRAARSIGELDAEIADAVDLVVDAGMAPGGLPSSVVEVSMVGGEESWVLLRAGAISVEVIKAAAGKEMGRGLKR
jgi:L-threonylcarbamoyladenylate synthase